MIVAIYEDDGVAPAMGAATMVMHHPAIPRGSVETYVFRIDQHGILRDNAYVGLFEPTQDYGITEPI